MVVAGCLQSASVDELNGLGLPHLKAALLDVTKDDSVAQFMVEVESVVAEKQDRTLHCLINNAGVGNGGAIDWLTMDAFKFDMEVELLFVVAWVPLSELQCSDVCKTHYISSSSLELGPLFIILALFPLLFSRMLLPFFVNIINIRSTTSEWFA